MKKYLILLMLFNTSCDAGGYTRETSGHTYNKYFCSYSGGQCKLVEICESLDYLCIPVNEEVPYKETKKQRRSVYD